MLKKKVFEISELQINQRLSLENAGMTSLLVPKHYNSTTRATSYLILHEGMLLV